MDSRPVHDATFNQTLLQKPRFSFSCSSPCHGLVFRRTSSLTRCTKVNHSTSNRSSPLPSFSTRRGFLSWPSRIYVLHALKSVRKTFCKCHVLRSVTPCLSLTSGEPRRLHRAPNRPKPLPLYSRHNHLAQLLQIQAVAPPFLSPSSSKVHASKCLFSVFCTVEIQLM
jgi:hypothetical protein